jgi:hypothetical protein
MVLWKTYSFFVKHVIGVCPTYFDKSRLPTEKCPICSNTEMSSFPILPNEAFTFNYNHKRGVELEFRPRKIKKNK